MAPRSGYLAYLDPAPRAPQNLGRAELRGVCDCGRYLIAGSATLMRRRRPMTAGSISPRQRANATVSDRLRSAGGRAVRTRDEAARRVDELRDRSTLVNAAFERAPSRRRSSASCAP